MSSRPSTGTDPGVAAAPLRASRLLSGGSRLNRLLPWSLLLTIVALAGCGGGPKNPSGEVAGSVVYRGKPLTKARIALNDSARGAGALVELDDTGHFQVPGTLPVGKYTITFMPPLGLSPLEAHAKGASEPTIDIPFKYASESTSDMKVEVKEGKNDFPLVIKEE